MFISAQREGGDRDMNASSLFLVQKHRTMAVTSDSCISSPINHREFFLLGGGR